MPRLSILVEGTVQGVGMRPFVFAAARAGGIVGSVHNGGAALHIEVQGTRRALDDFVQAIERCPPPARIERMHITEIEDRADDSFRILESDRTTSTRPVIPADLALCADCAEEMDQPHGRRFRYPFTNCARCGPRYAIVESLPYDRSFTSMKDFVMCSQCRAEYEDPRDRRFHAQPIACPACGPRLVLCASDGSSVAEGEEALTQSVRALLDGGVLALKGLGGFQLLVDATNSHAVARLRVRKRREAKPFAVLFASREMLRAYAEVSEEEERTLASSEAPILLVRGRERLAAEVAPGMRRMGAMLPCTPLHRLLARFAMRPLVCTSGNLGEEPMCTSNAEALERLRDVADLFLMHDRPVVRPVDDSVGRVGADGQLVVLRRARGFSPMPLRLAEGVAPVIALGGQLKSTVAIALPDPHGGNGHVVVSQHLGDLHSAEGDRLLERTVHDLSAFFGVKPRVFACDLHPDYASTRLAERLSAASGAQLVRVQHHHAHIAACMAEHGITERALGVAWDGAGYGPDGTIWGGEFLLCEGATFHRVGHLRPFALPGGERAMRDPKRTALALLHAVFGRAAAIEHARPWFSPADAETLLTMIERKVNAPLASSVGRLFDGIAALAGLTALNRFEGEAAMQLESAADGLAPDSSYSFAICNDRPFVLDWEPLVRSVVADRAEGMAVGVISARFHAALVSAVEQIAVRIGEPRVVLGGGCFQNERLEQSVCERLTARGFDVSSPRRYPPNDGGLSLGQVLVASRTHPR